MVLSICRQRNPRRFLRRPVHIKERDRVVLAGFASVLHVQRDNEGGTNFANEILAPGRALEYLKHAVVINSKEATNFFETHLTE